MSSPETETSEQPNTIEDIVDALNQGFEETGRLSLIDVPHGAKITINGGGGRHGDSIAIRKHVPEHGRPVLLLDEVKPSASDALPTIVTIGGFSPEYDPDSGMPVLRRGFWHWIQLGHLEPERFEDVPDGLKKLVAPEDHVGDDFGLLLNRGEAFELADGTAYWVVPDELINISPIQSVTVEAGISPTVD